MSGGVVEGILGDSTGLLSGDNFESLHHSRYTLMLQSTVLTLCVLTNHYNVNIIVSGKGGGEGRGGRGGKGFWFNTRDTEVHLHVEWCVLCVCVGGGGHDCMYVTWFQCQAHSCREPH